MGTSSSARARRTPVTTATPRPPWHRGGAFRTRPPEVLLLRAAIRQSRHEFDPALQDLSRLLEKDPRDPQAWLMQAVIFIVRADYRAARQACEALARLRRAFLAFSCMGSLASLSGQAEGGYGLLVLAKGHSEGATPAERVRLETLLGKTAERMGDRQRAEVHFQEARQLGPHDAYLLGVVRGFPPRPGARGRGGRRSCAKRRGSMVCSSA